MEQKAFFQMPFHVLLTELNQRNANIWRVFSAYGKFEDITVGGLLLPFSILPVKLSFETICCGPNPQECLMTLFQRKEMNYN